MSQKLIAGPVIGYKATDGNMQCKGVQFELGKLHELGNNDDLETCKNGFHFCQCPSGMWAYYDSGRVFKVEAYDVLDVEAEAGADFKRVCRKIKFIEEIKIDGDMNTGYWNTGNGNTGDRNTGYWNTGDRNTGNGNTGDGNTGNWNTGDWNTGYWNTGDGNTGDGNTGNGNATDYCSGFFCQEKQKIVFFDKETNLDRKDIDIYLVSQLSEKLKSSDPFDVTQFLSLPNATKENIEALHKEHIKRRSEKALLK